MKFNEKLKALREAKGLTQEDVASKLNISRQSVSKWEQGINEPDFETTKKLCQILECSLEELIDDDKEIILSKEERNINISNRLIYISFGLLIAGFLMVFGLIGAASEEVIIRWGVDGPVIGSKWFLFTSYIPLSLGLLVACLFKFVFSKKDPYRKNPLLNGIVVLISIIILITATFIVAGLMIKDHHKDYPATFNLLVVGVFAILSGIGPFTHPKFNKRNPFFGFRTSFTLESDYAWNKVNSFASIVLTAASVIGLVLSIIFIEYDWDVYFVLVVLGALIPVAFYHAILRKGY